MGASTGKFGKEEVGINTASNIDTALLKAALIVRPEVVRGLLQSPNECDLEESVRLLKEKKVYERNACFLANDYHLLGVWRDAWWSHSWVVCCNGSGCPIWWSCTGPSPCTRKR